MIDWSNCQAVERDPERMNGAWVFRGSRVPVSTLFENLEEDASVTDFIDWFQGVTLEQVQAVLEEDASVTDFIDWFQGVTLEQVQAVLDHGARSALAPAWVCVLFDQGTSTLG
jgi:uncharacterized protein (DUF433 family)